MHSIYGHWETNEAFEPLKHLAEKLFEVGGFHIQQQCEGARITIPASPETTPSFQELLEFRQARIARETPTD